MRAAAPRRARSGGVVGGQRCQRRLGTVVGGPGGSPAASVEVSISYVSDDFAQCPGVFVDDVAVSAGEGSTSFEDDGDTLDGWTVPGRRRAARPNENDWIVGTAAEAPPSSGKRGPGLPRPAARDNCIPRRLLRPVSVLGRRRDRRRLRRLGFALENQTRPIYSRDFFHDRTPATMPWSCTSWPTSGSATTWPWRRGSTSGSTRALPPTPNGCGANARAGNRRRRSSTSSPQSPPTNAFWSVSDRRSRADAIFDSAVYARGAMTLHALRPPVGDRTSSASCEWARTHAGGNVTTAEFIGLAERISGQRPRVLLRRCGCSLPRSPRAWKPWPGTPRPRQLGCRGGGLRRTWSADPRPAGSVIAPPSQGDQRGDEEGERG